MSRGIFITGTDTGVGKTIVSAVIIRSLIRNGVKVGAMKPIETGCSQTQDRRQSDNREKKAEVDLIPSDGMFLKEMAEMDDSIDLITPIRFELPLAPMVASDLEGRNIDIERIFSCYEFLSQKYEFMVVEGAGGLLVPILRRQGIYFFSDLVKDLKLPVILVARPSLGTINHTLLTIREAERRGLQICGVIINYSRHPEKSIAEKTNPYVLRELCHVPLLAEIPFIEDINIDSIDKMEIADKLRGLLNNCYL